MGLLLLLRGHWLQLLLLAVLTVLSAWVATLPPGLIRRVIDQALPSGDTALLLRLALLLVASLAAREGLRLAHSYAGALLGLRVTGRIRRALWQRVLAAPMGFFARTQRGEVLQRVLDDAEAVQGAAVQSWPRLLYELAVALVAALSLLQIDGGIGALALLIILLAAAPGGWIGQQSQRLGAETRQHQVAMTQQAQERLEAIRLVKSFTAEEREADRFRQLQEAWARAQLRYYLLAQSYMNVPRILEALAPMLVYLAGGYQLLADRLTLGQVVAMAGYIPLVNAPVRSFSRTYLTIKAAVPKLRAILEWLALEPEPGRALPRRPVSLRGDIRFEGVSFTYPGADRPVLQNATFTLKAGVQTALIGPSGAGKSTVLALLARLYEPDAGRITIGGEPLDRIHPTDLRQAIAFVGQEPFFLNDTIRRNLAFGLDRPVSEATLRESLRLVHLLDQLPDGLETVLGERGLRLSGGERQRLALARAFLREPQILLLDEATSALDNENQALVQAAIARVAAGRTSITVAHRLSTVAGAAVVLEVRDGAVREVAP
ncbi:MAG: ABC transporter ATP-binding protein [Bacillota bacterium]